MLAPGTRLGPYEIVALIGEGGMGQVYRAMDTRLDRTVAIKILPSALAADPQRRERFEREARTISRLEHPHICPLYDVGEHEGHAYLVMQLLEGETLADRLQRGPLSVAQTLEYGIQIAEALAAAHRAGIVHRDLKPGNVMLTRTGARLLDFGLARAAPGTSLSHTTIAATAVTGGLTTEGTILGTLSYMAPEQLDGREIDTRADVFAFGAVLFEMLTALKAFEGESPARVMSAILRDEPARVSTIVPVTPSALEALIHACLAKDPQDRWQNIGDVARQLRHLRDMLSGQRSGARSGPLVLPPPAAPPSTAPRRARRLNVAWIAAAVLGLTTVGLLVDRLRPAPAATAPVSLQAHLLPPEGMFLTDTMALSPDGRTLAFVAADPTGQRSLWLRPLDASVPQLLAGTDDASDPFWSPDGQHVAFFARGSLKRIAAAGGAATTLCQVRTGAGGSWNAANVMIFAQEDGPMMRIAATGGQPEPLTSFDTALGETHHLNPAFLPDGQHYIFYINSRERGLYVGELGSSTRTRLFDPDPTLPAAAAATPGIYSSTGHLLYVRDRVLTARQFDVSTRTVAGEPRTIVQTIDYDPPGQAAFTIANGLLIYRARQHRPLAELIWVDRRGQPIGSVPTPPGAFRTMSLSADGRRLAIDRRDAQGLPSVWLIDVMQGTTSRVTSRYWSGDPVWAPDGTLAYSVAADSAPNLVVRGDGGQAPERRVTQNVGEIHYANSFTPDARQIVYQAVTATTGNDLYLVSATDQTATPQRLLQTSANEMHGQVSPDGRWLAYTSDESGRPEVYVAPFPELQGRVALSVGGGQRPYWSRDGRQVFYLSADQTIMAASLSAAGTTLTPSTPESLFKATLYGGLYLPDPSGLRFLIARPAPTSEVVPLHIHVNPLR